MARRVRAARREAPEAVTVAELRNALLWFPPDAKVRTDGEIVRIMAMDVYGEPSVYLIGEGEHPEPGAAILPFRPAR